MATGTVKIYNGDKGWGFLTRDDGVGDVFVHVNDLAASGIKDGLRPGEKVSFDVVDSTHAKAKPGDKKALKVKRL
jgi:CspA family cold shock protein